MPHPITLLRQLQEVCRRVVVARQLVVFRPIPYGVEVPTLVYGIKVNKGLWAFSGRLIPHLAKQSDISGTHELLADDV
jgi:hypothetical protein